MINFVILQLKFAKLKLIAKAIYIYKLCTKLGRYEKIILSNYIHSKRCIANFYIKIMATA